jgi:hypothetical protein
MDRHVIAYGLIAMLVLAGSVAGWVSWRKHKRIRLRRRGIKGPHG